MNIRNQHKQVAVPSKKRFSEFEFPATEASIEGGCESPKRTHIGGGPPRTPSPTRKTITPRASISMSTVTNSGGEDGRQVVFLDNGRRVVLGADRSVSNFGKQLAPAIVRTHEGAIAAVAVISETEPLSLGGNPAQFGVLETFKLEGSTVQLLRRGVPLSDLMKWLKARPEPPTVKLELMLRHVQSTIPILETLHLSGLAHMDVKPGNLVALSDGVGVIDIDRLPRIASDDKYASDANFGSPTQPRVASTASDVFSLGGVLGEIRTKFTTGNEPIRRTLTELIKSMREKERHNRPDLTEVSVTIRAIQDPIDPTEIDRLHQEFLLAHPPIFNVDHPRFFEKLFESNGGGSSW